MLSSIPNLITSLRLLLAIPISISIYQGKEELALILFVMAGVSDSLDGFLARKYNWESKSGQLLDPLADKCLILGTLLALAFSAKLPLWLVSILLTRDAIIVLGAILYLKLFDNANTISNRWGKHYTGWTIALFVIVLLQDILVGLSDLFDLLLVLAKLGVLAFGSLSLLFYFRDPGRVIFTQLFGSR